MFKIVIHRLRTVPLVQYTTSKKVATHSASKSLAVSFNTAVKEAEKVVGYPTSFLNLRWLLNDEIANIATHIKKLMHAEHPLIETAKGFLFKSDVSSWGLIVLLVAKCGGLNNCDSAIEIDQNAGILHSQRILADVAEMIKTSILVHRGLLNPDNTQMQQDNSDLNFGNKLALLCGDYILGKCFNDLANIKNHDVNILISSTLRDLTENEFLGQRDGQNFPLPAKPIAQQTKDLNLIDTADMGPYRVNDILGHSKPEWFLRNILGGANLLGKSCQAACMLTNQDDKLQENAYHLGKSMALAWQLKIEIEMFQRKEFDNYFLVSAPVMWCLSSHPQLYDEILPGMGNIENCDFDKIHVFISGTSAVEECLLTQNELIGEALGCLDTFDESPAKESIRDLLKSLNV